MKPFSAPTRAAFVEKYRCADCSEVSDAPMLDDELWLSIARREDYLCFTCAERRLGRLIMSTDLNDSLMSHTFRRLLSNELARITSPSLCEECQCYRADPPSRLCPGCEAYREHQR